MSARHTKVKFYEGSTDDYSMRGKKFNIVLIAAMLFGVRLGLSQTGQSKPAFTKKDIAACDENKLLDTYKDSNKDPNTCGKDKINPKEFDKVDGLAKSIKDMQCKEAENNSCAYNNKTGDKVTDSQVSGAMSAFKGSGAPAGLKSSIPDDDLKNSIRSKMESHARKFGCSNGVKFAGWDSFVIASTPYLSIAKNNTDEMNNKKNMDIFAGKLPTLSDDDKNKEKDKWDAYLLKGAGAGLAYDLVAQLEKNETAELKNKADRPQKPKCEKYYNFEEACNGKQDEYLRQKCLEQAKKQPPKCIEPADYNLQVKQWQSDYVRYRISPSVKFAERQASKYSTYSKKNPTVLEGDSFMFCSGKKESSGLKMLAVLHPPCGSNLGLKSADNVSDFKAADFNQDPDFKSCLDHAKKSGLEIDKIQIKSSASKLANTGEAATKFCPHGFLALSCARATSTKDSITKEFGKAGGFFKDYAPTGQDVSSLITVDASGSNGDGTSGDECPYELDKGNPPLPKLKAGYEKGGSKRAGLDKNKYVRVNISFKDSKNQVNKPVFDYSAQATGCQTMKFSCQ